MHVFNASYVAVSLSTIDDRKKFWGVLYMIDANKKTIIYDEWNSLAGTA